MPLYATHGSFLPVRRLRGRDDRGVGTEESEPLPRGREHRQATQTLSHCLLHLYETVSGLLRRPSKGGVA